MKPTVIVDLLEMQAWQAKHSKLTDRKKIIDKTS